MALFILILKLTLKVLDNITELIAHTRIKTQEFWSLASDESCQVWQETLVLLSVGLLEVRHVLVQQFVDDLLLFGIAPVAFAATLQLLYVTWESQV